MTIRHLHGHSHSCPYPNHNSPQIASDFVPLLLVGVKKEEEQQQQHEQQPSTTTNKRSYVHGLKASAEPLVLTALGRKLGEVVVVDRDRNAAKNLLRLGLRAQQDPTTPKAFAFNSLGDTAEALYVSVRFHVVFITSSFYLKRQ